MIICAFPGVGKTHLFNTAHTLNLDVVDSDSSQFAKGQHWPGNYVRHLLDADVGSTIVLASTHEEVRERLINEVENDAFDHRLVLVYPSREQKGEYVSRYIARGSPPVFCELMEARWDEFIDSLEAQGAGWQRVVLEPGQYLGDVMPQILDGGWGS